MQKTPPAAIPLARYTWTRRIASVLALACLLASAATAAEVLVQTLPNGLSVVIEENHTRPLAAAALVVRGGSRTETPELSGLSHYYEHLIFRGGSEHQAELEFRRQMQQLGEESGGYTSDDYTNYGFTVPKQNFEEALDRSTDAWLTLVPTQAKVDQERQVVLEEYSQGQDRPDYQVYYQLIRSLYQVHPYHTSPIGRREVIEGASLETFRTFYEERYVPNHMILALVGDFDADSVLSRVRDRWSTARPGKPSFEQGLIEPEQTQFRFLEQALATSVTRAVLGFPIPPAGHADIAALELLAALLGDGNSSRLWEALKVRADVVTAVSSGVEARVDPGFLEIDLECEPAKLDEALRLIAEEVTRIATTPPLVDELNRVREAKLARRDRGLETPFERAEALAVAQMLGSAHDLDRAPALWRAVTREDITRVARTYLVPNRANLSVVRPKESASCDPTAWMARWEDAWSESVALGAEAANGAGSDPIRFLLKNQVSVVVKPEPDAAMVGAIVLWRGGQWIEPEGRAGLTNMAARLLDKGAFGRSQIEIADRLAEIGATLSVSGGPDYVSLRVECPAKNQRTALEILADVATGPTFPPDEIEKVRGDILSSIRARGDRPFDATNVEFYARLYTHAPYARPVEGTETSVAGITELDLRELMKRHLTGRNLVIAVTGSVDPLAVQNWAETRFAGIPPGVRVTFDQVLRDAPPNRASDVHIARDQEQTTYNTGWTTLAVTDPDFLALRTAVGVLGDRFFFKYVYEKGVAYRSWFYQTERLGQGSAQNEMGVAPDVYAEISGEVVDDLRRFATEPILPDEVEAAKRRILARAQLSMQRSVDLAERLAFYELAGLGFDYVRRYPELLRAVTPAEASAAARKYLPEGRWTRIAIGAPASP